MRGVEAEDRLEKDALVRDYERLARFKKFMEDRAERIRLEKIKKLLPVAIEIVDGE